MSPDAERSRAVYSRYVSDGGLRRISALKERDQERFWVSLYYRLGGRNDRALRRLFGGRNGVS